MQIPRLLGTALPLAAPVATRPTARASGGTSRGQVSAARGAPSFPRAPDLTDLAARLEPPERAKQLALALEGPGMPVELKLATLRMMLEGPALPLDTEALPQASPPDEPPPSAAEANTDPAEAGDRPAPADGSGEAPSLGTTVTGSGFDPNAESAADLKAATTTARGVDTRQGDATAKTIFRSAPPRPPLAETGSARVDTPPLQDGPPRPHPRAGAVIPPTLAAHVSNGAAGTTDAVGPKSTLDVTG